MKTLTLSQLKDLIKEAITNGFNGFEGNLCSYQEYLLIDGIEYLPTNRVTTYACNHVPDYVEEPTHTYQQTIEALEKAENITLSIYEGGDSATKYKYLKQGNQFILQ